MSFELHYLFLFGLAYLLLLFGIAHLADKGHIPERFIRHPITYILSLGVFTSAWAIYGAVGMAKDFGYGFLTYYLGIAIFFFLSPVILLPILRITHNFRHSSLADLLTFRYRSQLAGSLITFFMLMALLPLLALQIQAVAESLQLLSPEIKESVDSRSRHNEIAFIYCIVIGIFAIFFGSKQLTAHQRHNGLVATIAFESIVKLVALFTIGFAAIYVVFDGFSGLELWLESQPAVVEMLSKPVKDDSARALLVIFFTSAVTMPHLFHMIFAEGPSPRVINSASWGVPLYLLLMSLPILPILWAGYKLDTQIPAEYFTLAIGIELNSTPLAMLAYIGGLSAASGAVIVITLALASMCLKHLILPIYRPSSDRDIYRWLLWIRRGLIAFIILAGYLFYRFIDGRIPLSSLGMAAFIATLQFFPGVLATMYSPKANHKGFIAGLIAGFSIWFLSILIPILSNFQLGNLTRFYDSWIGPQHWSTSTITSLSLNMLVFWLVSALTKTSDEEKTAAIACSTEELSRPTRRLLSVNSPKQFAAQLATALGTRTAEREVDRALKDMKMSTHESRPFALRRLRYRLETNLSGLLGPSVANDMINQLIPYENNTDKDSSEDINLIETQLENYKLNLTGLAVDLDNLRRYHRQTLQDLPVGVCSLGQDNEILMWNDTIAKFTGIPTFDVIGSNLQRLAAPWGKVLSDFLKLQQPHLYKQHIQIDGNNLWFNLHKTTVDATGAPIDGRVIVLEDNSDVQLLEEELIHSERLASIGRLAAGVAHEIGNPITGIACLAQNLRYETDNPDSLEAAREILIQTDRVSKIVQTLVNFAHAGTENSKLELGPVHLKSCADEAIHLLQLNKGAKHVIFENHCDNDQYAKGDAQRLLQVIVNLLSNARDASPADSTISVSCNTRSHLVFLSVTDNGTGISKALQEQIFDPFFTTKEAGEGTGLGLSLVYSIIDDLGGHISVESPIDGTDRGTRFTVRLRNIAPD